jgi:sulfite reductase (ferredoxin)
MSKTNGTANNLLGLGSGGGSKVERNKAESRHLRGKIALELAQPTRHFSEEQVQLLKFHGTYQQDQRDERKVRNSAGAERAYQFMVRSRIPGGVLTAAQYLVEDDLAEKYGNGTLRITSRQGFQLHGVLKGDLHATIHAINKALLTTLAACGDVNRNVMACPAPIANSAQAQVAKIAHSIAMHLAPRTRAYHEIWVDGEQLDTVPASRERKRPEDPRPEAEPIYGPTYLPRKFKIGVAAPGDNCIDVYSQDIGLVPVMQGDALAGFTVLIGGGMGMTHGNSETYPRLATPLCTVPVADVLPVAETIVTIQRDYGDRQDRKHARMKYLVEERGIEWFREELERRLGRAVGDPQLIHWHSAEDHLGWHRQVDGRWFLGLFVETGRIKDEGEERLRTGLRHAIERFRPGIHLTPHQNILLTDLTEAQRQPLEAMLADFGISADPAAAGVRRHSLACPALPTCGLALAEAERLLPSVLRQIDANLEELSLAGEPLSVRMTGCPNGCARPYLGDIGFVGRSKERYHIYVGGDRHGSRMNSLFAEDVPASELAATIRPLLARWRDGRRPEEGFGDFCHRVGIENLPTAAINGNESAIKLQESALCQATTP